VEEQDALEMVCYKCWLEKACVGMRWFEIGFGECV
jgi:hypothetical protein